jgi:RNA polymerase sigma-70 factor (ECF subfamily)
MTDEARNAADEPSSSRARFEDIFYAHADAVLAYALRRSDPDTAQEVVAETFTIAWRRMGDVPDPALPWLLGTARRVLANTRRASSRRRELTLRLEREPDSYQGDRTRDVDTDLAARDALASLPPSEREAMELLAWEGLSPAEAARVLGCSRRVIAVRVHRARKKLRAPMTAALDLAAQRPTDLVDPNPSPTQKPQEAR